MLRPLRIALFLAIVLGARLACGLVPRDTVVELSATVQESPPQITLQWVPAGPGVAFQKVYRRLKGAQQWSDLATPANSATTYVDAAVSAGVSYEYFLYRILDLPDGDPALGCLNAGIRLPLVEQRGKVILLVDDSMSGPLAAELSRLIADLSGDGWVVLRQDVSRTAAVPAVKGIVQSHYNADPASTRALILFGRIPVPYSGEINPDGHPDHRGAWPADVYYADVDGAWTDSSVNNTTASRTENRNVPGDGKWDQSSIPSNVELETGRIDLSNMNNVPSGVSETELLRQYLNRDHDFRHKTGAFANIPRRGLIADGFGYFSGEAFAASGWRNFASFFGSAPGSVVEGNWFGTLQTNTYLWAYGCGGGSYTSAGGIGSSSDFATKKSLAVFNALFGSYFGDWDNADNFLRAPLAGLPDSLGLVSIWAGRPHCHFYHMGMGETVGYGARVTQNNTGLASEGYVVNNSGRGVHVALMGDPTLRLHPVVPVADFSIAAGSGTPVLTWTAAADTAVQGYAVYRAATSAGPFIRLGGALVTGTSYTDRAGQPGQSHVYQVRTVKLESGAGGTYLNNSEGMFASATPGAASGPEINVTGAGQPVSAGDAQGQAANGTGFGSAEVNLQVVTHTFALANDGIAPLGLTGTPVVALSGSGAADFSVVAQPPNTVAAGSAVAFQIVFAPTTEGERTATVSILSNDPDESPFQFVVSGDGLPPSATIAVTPVSIDRTVNPGNSTTVPLTISDHGAGALSHTLSTSHGGYSATDSNSFGGPAYSWIEISATGTEVTGFDNPDDGISAPISLGFAFPFPFFGNSFTSLRVCTNGFISFTDSAAPWGNTPLPAFGSPRNLIAAFWDDLILDPESKIFTQQTGNTFVVQFNDIALFSSTTQRITCEIILKQSGEILLQYKDVTETDHDYTVGIQNGFRTEGLQLALNTNYVQPGLAVRIAPPGFYSWLSFSVNSGTVPPSGSQAIDVALNSAGLSAGQYAATIYVDSNDASLPRWSVPVRFTVGVTPVESWRLANFGTTANTGSAADGADPEHDGLANVLEYALTLDPNAESSGGVPATSAGAGGYLCIQFTRNAARTDVTYTVEASSNLIAWTPIARALAGAPTSAITAHSAVESGAGDVKAVIVEDAMPMAANAARFLRLRVTRTE